MSATVGRARDTTRHDTTGLLWEGQACITSRDTETLSRKTVPHATKGKDEAMKGMTVRGFTQGGTKGRDGEKAISR